ncbi:MAG: hypothetical protein DMD99_08205 [Candidatus Rokuibacteriota bacterium]|nr:MAG: hypothetical protein DMD99_08205 [Candidatus Rokubacteria bacterium]
MRLIGFGVVLAVSLILASLAAETFSGSCTRPATSSGLMSYGVDYPDLFRQVAVSADKVLKGANLPTCKLAGDLPAPLRIGIHAGPAVVGRMGWGASFYLTAVGDTVHVAARLEHPTKDYGAELVVSEDVARRAGLDLSAFPGHGLAVRNRTGRVCVRVVQRVASLPGET